MAKYLATLPAGAQSRDAIAAAKAAVDGLEAQWTAEVMS
jgi:hypothetical protein